MAETKRKRRKTRTLNGKSVISGRLLIGVDDDINNLLMITNEDDNTVQVFVRRAEDEMANARLSKDVRVRYLISDKKIESEDEAAESRFAEQIGTHKLRYDRGTYVYSELTAADWVDEDFIVGGHNLVEELKSFAGKWLYMVVEYEFEDVFYV